MADERGSVTSVTNDAGTVIALNSYDEYGRPGSGNQGRFQYTGQAWIPELDLYYYKARMYNPEIGRFMQIDPIGYADGLNWYDYVGGDPVNFVDPLGLSTSVPEVSCSGGQVPDGKGGCSILVTGTRYNLDLGLDHGDVAFIMGPPRNYEPASDRPQNEIGSCEKALKEKGRVKISFLTGSFIAITGGYGITGQFENEETGTKGFFWSVGGGFGYDTGFSLYFGNVISLAKFSGNGKSISGGRGLGGAIIYDADGNKIGSAKGFSGRGLSGTFGRTKIYGCEAKK